MIEDANGSIQFHGGRELSERVEQREFGRQPIANAAKGILHSFFGGFGHMPPNTGSRSVRGPDRHFARIQDR